MRRCLCSSEFNKRVLYVSVYISTKPQETVIHRNINNDHRTNPKVKFSCLLEIESMK